MTYRDVNPDRLEWLLKSGLTPKEVSTFFREKQKALMLKAVKVQNLPGDDSARLALIQRFGDDAHRVFSDWLSLQSREGEGEYARQLLAWYTSIESNKLTLPDDQHRPLARAGLRALYSEKVDADWLAFLRSEMDSQPRSVVEPVAPTAPTPDDFVTPQDMRRFVAWALGSDQGSGIESPQLSRVVQVTELLRAASAREAAPSKIAESEWAELLELKRSIRTRAPKLGMGTVNTTQPIEEDFDPEFDYTALDAICIPTRMAGNGPWFFDVLGFLRDHDVITLNPSAMRSALPEEGRVILYPHPSIAPPLPGVAESFKVERHWPQKAIKIRATARTHHLLPVIYVPHASSDPDAVRAWISERAVQLSARPVLLILADGVSLRARDDAGRHLGSANFEWNFDRWNSTTVLQLGQNAYAIAPLPKPDALYECLPIGAIAKRVFKGLADTKDLGVSKAQLAKIAERLAGPELRSMAADRERIVRGVLALSDAEADYDALVAEVMRSPYVQRDIEARKATRLAELDDANTQERAKLENLRRATQQQQGRLDKLKEQAEERVREIKLAVRKAFDAAREKEAETIGQLAIWSTLLGSPERAQAESKGSEPAAAPISPAPPAIRVELVAPMRIELARTFRSAGIDDESTRIFTVACDVARQARIPVLINGAGARYVSLEISRAFATRGVTVLDVGIGCISPDVMREALRSTEADVILVRGVDHSDPWLFAPDLLDTIVQRATLPPVDADARFIVLSRASGPAALPLPTEVEHLSLKLDLSQSVQKGHQVDAGAIAPLRQKMRARVEAILQAKEEFADLVAVIPQLV